LLLGNVAAVAPAVEPAPDGRWIANLRRGPGPRLLSIACLAALLFLLPLKDQRPLSAQAEFDRAHELFLHGYPELSQEQAEQGYIRFLNADPDWASRFQLLEAESMEWRGLYKDAQRELAAPAPGRENPQAAIQRLTIEAVALIHLEDPAANRVLSEAEGLCARDANADCEEVIRARGLLAVEQGRFADARELFFENLNFARVHSDHELETTALMNLGVAMLQQERYDEALDWFQAARRAAVRSGDVNLEQVISGNLGDAYLGLGDIERGLELFLEAEKQATELGNVRTQIYWLLTAGNAYFDSGDPARAARSYRQALQSALRIGNNREIINSLEDLAHASIAAGDLNDADSYVTRLNPLVRETISRLDDLDMMLAQGKIAAARRQDQQAKDLFTAVEKDRDSQTSMRLGAEHELARLLESENDDKGADNMYRTALTTFETARADLKNEDSKLPFLTNATPIYDDYIHFLVSHGKAGEALNVADQSRARTLAQGLGFASAQKSFTPVTLHPQQIARKTGATLLFYWLGAKQSYLWAITPKKAAVFPLPAQAQLTPLIERYRQTLLGPIDPADAGNEDGRALYDLLVAPAAELIGADANVVLLTDGALSQLNFETLLAPGKSPFGAANKSDGTAHYWIDDATLVSAPSLSMLAAARPSRTADGNLLLVGDAVSPNPDYPELPMAGAEMSRIEKHFDSRDRTVFMRQAASPAAYLKSAPGRFTYIHFVTHGVASRTDPLDSAIILSRTGDGEDSFKLHARDIIRQPIDARLVTVSACYGSGERSYAGEGLVGLSWAFLRAGAHNVIAALWEASDESTPKLMDNLYQGLADGLSPAVALRRAKLALLHSRTDFRKPFFWGSFQIYTGH